MGKVLSLLEEEAVDLVIGGSNNDEAVTNVGWGDNRASLLGATNGNVSKPTWNWLASSAYRTWLASSAYRTSFQS